MLHVHDFIFFLYKQELFSIVKLRCFVHYIIGLVEKNGKINKKHSVCTLIIINSYAGFYFMYISIQ